MEMCGECREVVIVVQDYAAGDTICTKCGLVLESHMVDERAEWRTFLDDVNSSDPDRVGAPSNHLLTDGGLATMIFQPKGNNKSSSLLLSQHTLAPKADKSLLAAFKLIAAMIDRLGLLQTIRDLANEIYKQINDLHYARGRSKNAIAGACIFVACRQEGTPRTYKEITAVANGAKLREIGRAAKEIVRHLEAANPKSVRMGAINAVDYARRFCSRLGMGNTEIRAVSQTITASKKVVHVRGNPATVVAAAILMVSQLSEAKKSLKDVASVAGVVESTVRSSYRELHPFADQIIPSWFADRVKMMSLLKL